MEKTCSNHPESLALATCKACEKAICLMCVHDEREGTFCSEGCIKNFREVSDWVGTGSEGAPPPAPSPAPAQASSVFEEMPERPSAAVEAPPEPAPEPEPVAEAAPEPEPEAPPPVPAGPTIGNPCYQHADIRAKAFCTRCRRPICGLCIVENPTGMFCSEECAKNQRGRRGSPAGLKVAAAFVLLAVAAGAVYAVKPELLGLGSPENPIVSKPSDPTPPLKSPEKDPIKPEPPKPEPPKPQPPKPAPEPEVVKTPIEVPADPGVIEVAKVTRPAPPKPEAPKPTRFLSAWGQESPGAWHRIRTEEAGKPVFVDFGLKARDAEASVLLVQKHAGGKPGPVVEKREPHQTVYLDGEETIRLEDRAYLCEIRESQDGSVRQWVLVQGRHAGAVLKSEGPEGAFVADRLWENPVRAGLRVYDCLVVEGTLGSEGRRMKTWYSPAFPMGAVRVEIDGKTVALAVDSGMSWDDRPGAPK